MNKDDKHRLPEAPSNAWDDVIDPPSPLALIFGVIAWAVIITIGVTVVVLFS